MGAREGAGSAGRGPLLVAVIGAAAVAVVGVLLAGPLQVSVERWPGVVVAPATHRAPTPPPPLLGPSSRQLPMARTAGTDVILVAAVLVAAAVCVLIVWLIRRMLARRVELVTVEPAAAPEDETGSTEGRTVAAPAMRRGLARALELLERPTDPSDAVVQAWLGLEDAALLAGTPRGPAETPSEYATRIVQRHAADREAADALRALYEAVRFGGAVADVESVAVARRCLTALLASWTRDPEPAMR